MKRIVFPESWTTDEWYGFTRHNFEFEGCRAWVVEPEFPAGDGRWSWCTVWPESFVKRVGTLELLEHGFYHVHVDAFGFRASPEGIALMGRFQELLVKLGLSPKANLIGMSWGGFFSLRYAETFPERVCAIYLDAPVCNAADPEPNAAKRLATILENYHLSFEEMAKSKLNPLNNVEPIVEAGIPLFAAVGKTDLTVTLGTNFDLLEKRILELGGAIKVIRREGWGHHPHGLDEPKELLAFHCAAREK